MWKLLVSNFGCSPVSPQMWKDFLFKAKLPSCWGNGNVGTISSSSHSQEKCQHRTKTLQMLFSWCLQVYWERTRVVAKLQTRVTGLDLDLRAFVAFRMYVLSVTAWVEFESLLSFVWSKCSSFAIFCSTEMSHEEVSSKQTEPNQLAGPPVFPWRYTLFNSESPSVCPNFAPHLHGLISLTLHEGMTLDLVILETSGTKNFQLVPPHWRDLLCRSW